MAACFHIQIGGSDICIVPSQLNVDSACRCVKSGEVFESLCIVWTSPFEVTLLLGVKSQFYILGQNFLPFQVYMAGIFMK